jgi:hypothetical protein
VSFLGELKRRNVFRLAEVYAGVRWLIVQVAAAIEMVPAIDWWPRVPACATSPGGVYGSGAPGAQAGPSIVVLPFADRSGTALID